ncbi:MAG: nitroreductase family protein [archaeon]
MSVISMNVKEAIESRRSIRKYKDKKVPDNLITEVINAARLAPSGNNAQPSRYLIVKDDKAKKKLKDNKIIRDEWAYDAPVIIVCCADPKAYTKSVEGWDDANKLRAIRDMAIASSFLVLQATELGLGTCYCGWIEKEKIKKVLGIPQHFIVQYVITLGYPAETPKSRPRKEIDEILL